MKITEVNVYDLVYPVKQPFANSRSWNRSRSAVVVEVKTDNGLIGWGEGSAVPSQRDIENHVIGRSPFEYERIYDDMSPRGRNARAACGVEIALWDLMGKAMDQPVCQILGGPRWTEIEAYASGLFKKEGEDHAASLAEEAKRYADMGFSAVKMKIGFGREQDERIVESVRKAIGGDVKLAVDANCGYDPATAIEVGRRIDPYDLLWYEEPIAAEDVAGYLAIKRALPHRLAGGEALQSRWAFREMVQQRAVDVIQPDISIAGGFTECKRIASLASTNYVSVLPHVWGGVVRLAATLHWQAIMPNAPNSLNPFPNYLEFDMTENGLRTELGVEAFTLENGKVKVPEGPGLGIEIKREVLEKYVR